MTRVEEMASLTEAIARSFDSRVTGLAALKHEVANQRHTAGDRLRAIAATRQEMAANLRQQMAGDHQALQSQVREMRGGFNRTRAEVRAAQSESLAADHRRRAEDIRAFLAKTRDDREAAAAALREKRAAERADQQAAVRELLTGTRSHRMAMAEDQARELSRYRTGLQAEVSESIADFQASRATLRANLGEVGQRWREFATLMRSKRADSSSGFVREHTTPAKAPPPERVAAEGPVGSGAASFSAPPAASPENGSRTAEEVLLAMQANPAGIKLADLEYQFNMSRIEMAQVLKRLMDEGRVRKEEKLYFVV